jgi:hypothetical protein
MRFKPCRWRVERLAARLVGGARRVCVRGPQASRRTVLLEARSEVNRLRQEVETAKLDDERTLRTQHPALRRDAPQKKSIRLTPDGFFSDDT